MLFVLFVLFYSVVEAEMNKVGLQLPVKILPVAFSEFGIAAVVVLDLVAVVLIGVDEIDVVFVVSSVAGVAVIADAVAKSFVLLGYTAVAFFDTAAAFLASLMDCLVVFGALAAAVLAFEKSAVHIANAVHTVVAISVAAVGFVDAVIVVVVVEAAGTDVVASAFAGELLLHSHFSASYLDPQLGPSWTLSLPFVFPLMNIGLFAFG